MLPRESRSAGLDPDTAKKLLVGESNPGRLRDRQKCYQLHQRGSPVGYLVRRWDSIPLSQAGARSHRLPRGSPTAIRGSNPPKSDTFSIFACHPCAGAMLIFSVSFQFLRMMPKHSGPNPRPPPYPRPEASLRRYCCGGALKHASKNCSVAPGSITERGIG